MESVLECAEPCGFGGCRRRGREMSGTPVPAECVEIRCERLDERKDVFCAGAFRWEVRMDDAAVAERDAAHGMACKGVGECGGAVRGGFQDDVRKAVGGWGGRGWAWGEGELCARLRGDAGEFVLECVGLVRWAVDGDAKEGRSVAGDVVDGIPPVHPTATEEGLKAGVEGGGGAVDARDCVEAGVRSEAEDVVEWFSEAGAGMEEEAEPVVAGGGFDDAFADACGVSAGEAPVDAEDVVAVGAEAVGGGGVRGSGEVLCEGCGGVGEEGEPEVVCGGLGLELGGGGVGGDAECGVDRVHEPGEQAFGSEWLRRFHGVKRRAVRTFRGLS